MSQSSPVPIHKLNSLIREHWVALSLFFAYILVFSHLSLSEHDALRTAALDLGYYSQVIWNTSQGRFFENSLMVKPSNYLGDHFSPFLVILAPLYWIWPDARALLIMTTVTLAAGALPLYGLLAHKDKLSALAVLLAYYLNPLLHQSNLSQFNDITLAVPLMSIALYALLRDRPMLALLASLLTLSVKEELAVFVLMMGALLFAKRGKRRIGLVLIVSALLWLPAVAVIQVGLSEEPLRHYTLRYTYLGESPQEVIYTLITNPGLIASQLLAPAQREATWRLLWPTAFLPLLAPEVALIGLPILAYLLMSTDPLTQSLDFWYPARLLPVLFAATALGLHRLGRFRTLGIIALLGLSTAAFRFYSEAPLGMLFDPSRLETTSRTRLGQQLTHSLPDDLSVSAQTHLFPHVPLREEMYLFPYPKTDQADLIVLDRLGNPWPFTPDQYQSWVTQALSLPIYDIVYDGYGFLVLRRVPELPISFRTDARFEKPIVLFGFDLALGKGGGPFEPAKFPMTLHSGDTLRLSLWWRAERKMGQDYTIFTHILDSSNRVVTGHDSMPAQNSRPTTSWKPGEVVRDIHYLTIGDVPERSQGIMEIGLYLWTTGERVRLVSGEDRVVLGQVTLSAAP